MQPTHFSPTPTNDSPHHLFVYGTLRKNAVNSNHPGMQNATLKGRGICRGKLYNLGWFPGVRLDQEGSVIGEVFEFPIDDGESFRMLDGYEGCRPHDPTNSLYTRERTPVRLDSGQTVWCWIYQINHQPDDEALIQSGDWLNETDTDE